MSRRAKKKLSPRQALRRVRPAGVQTRRQKRRRRPPPHRRQGRLVLPPSSLRGAAFALACLQLRLDELMGSIAGRGGGTERAEVFAEGLG